MAQKIRTISADSHLEISPERWTPRVPARYRDRAPRLVKLADGGDGVTIENRRRYVLGLAITGTPYEDHKLSGLTYEGSPGAGSAEQRLKEQDRDGVDAEVIFASVGIGPNMWRGISDDAVYQAVVHAYNEFLGEEYCPVAPDRLIAMGVIPSSGIEDAIAEMEYCARVGLKGIALNNFPSGKGFPTPEDDRFWAAAVDLGIPVTVHITFMERKGPTFNYKHDPGEVGFGADPVGVLTRFGGRSGLNAVQLMLAEVFDRFPKLKIFWAETQISWVPYFLDQLDDTYERSRHWMKSDFGLAPLKRKPSEYIREHCWWGFIYDAFGVRSRHDVGLDRVMWCNDFPHSAGDWPQSQQRLDEMFVGVPETERYKVVAGNAVEFFHLAN